MAIVVTSRILLDTPLQTVVHLTGVVDGVAANEAAVLKVDKSTLVPAIDGAEANSLEIEAVRWCMQGFTRIEILWDHTADDLAVVLSGNGYDDLFAKALRGIVQGPGLTDPRSAGDTGDILLTTVGAAAQASYDITLVLRKASS